MDEQKVPVLTLNTQSGAQQALEQAVAQLEAPDAPNADNAVAAALDDNFSAEERAEIERFAGTIDVTNPDHVMLYGADAQKKVSEFADSILNTVKNTDSGEVGDILTNLITELKSFEGSTKSPRACAGCSSTPRRSWPPCRRATMRYRRMSRPSLPRLSSIRFSC